MNTDFWLQRWENNDIGFHQHEANPLLTQYFRTLSLAEGGRLFLPLCGKTRDIGWLLSKGYRVAGAELSELAIEQLFAELGATLEVSGAGELRHYQAPGIDIFVGDLFQLTGKMLGPVDAIYDRAALVALPEETRQRYAAHLMEITNGAPQLLITYESDQQLMDGPPFSISPAEVRRHYDDSYDVAHLACAALTGSLKERLRGEPVSENVWHLRPNPS